MCILWTESNSRKEKALMDGGGFEFRIRGSVYIVTVVLRACILESERRAFLERLLGSLAFLMT